MCVWKEQRLIFHFIYSLTLNNTTVICINVKAKTNVGNIIISQNKIFIIFLLKRKSAAI